MKNSTKVVLFSILGIGVFAVFINKTNKSKDNGITKEYSEWLSDYLDFAYIQGRK